MKKFLSILLAFLMLCSVVTGTGITVNGAESTVSDTSVTSGDFKYWALDETTAQITGYVGSDAEITIPTTLAGYTVVSIGEDAFYECINLTSVTIPDSVTSIGEWAFGYCTSLTSTTISDSVTSIGNHAFYMCTSLTSITIPDSVTSIGDDAFAWCTGLTSITIPDSVTSIGDCAFYNCESLTSVTIGNSVTSISSSAFMYCTSLTSITIPDSVTSIGNNAFSGCTSLTSITIPDSVTSIGEGAFGYCTSLTSITIPASVTSIGDYAFYGCDNLVMYGYDGSYAQTYAEENYVTFVIIKTSLNATKKNMNSGDTFKITVKNANGAKVKYSISNADKKIIKVSAKGKVTALQKGTATVNVTVGDTTLKCKITVKTDPYLTNAKGKKITGVTVKKGGKATVYIQGKAKSLKNAYVGNKTAKISGNKSKAKFTVKGLKKGTTTVKVRINRVKTLNLKVKVK